MDIFETLISNFDDPFSFWQILGWIAVPIYLGSYQLFKPKHTMAAQIPADILYCLHFFGMGAVLPAMIAFVSPFRNLLAIKGSEKQLKIGLVVFLLYIWGCGYFFANNIFLILLVLGSTIKNTAYFFRDRFWGYRFSLFSFQILYPGSFLAAFNMASNVIGMIRYLFNQRHGA